jgi:hypothetical protein
MLPIATDEDVHGNIITGIRRRDPTIDLVRVQDAGRRSSLDPDILEWAATEGRILVTQEETRWSATPGTACVAYGQKPPASVAQCETKYSPGKTGARRKKNERRKEQTAHVG